MKNTYKKYIFDKIMLYVLFVIIIIVGIILRGKEIIPLALIGIVVFWDTRTLCFILDDWRKGALTREAIFEHTDSSSLFEGSTWWGLGERYPQIYSVIRFRDKDLSGTFYVFGDDRKLVIPPDMYNRSPIKRGDSVEITYFEKSRLIVNIKKK